MIRQRLALPNLDHSSGLMRPRWRGRLHLAAALFSGPVSIALIASAHTSVSRAGVCVFALGMITVFGVSALYHVFARTPRSQSIMKRADHAAIYLLIAATITPISLLVPPRSIGVPLLAMVWISAVIGAFLKITGRRDRLASNLYPIIGWTTVIMLPWLWQTSRLCAVAVLASGVIYSIGAALFSKSLPRLSERVFGYHEFWHVMTIIASGLNYLAVRGIVKALP